MAMVIRDIKLDNEKFSQLFAILVVPILRGKIKMVARLERRSVIYLIELCHLDLFSR